MDKLLVVDVEQSVDSLGEVLVNELLVEFVFFHSAEEIPVLGVFEDQVDLVFFYEIVKEFDDVGVHEGAVLDRLLNHAPSLVVSQAV